MIINKNLLFLFIILGFDCTGVYTQFPGYSVIIILLSTINLFLEKNFFKEIPSYITKKNINGFLMLVIFFLVEIILYKIDLINIRNISISIYMMVLTFIYTKKIIIENKNTQLGIIILITLLIILIGQILQITNYITPINPEFLDYYNNSSEDNVAFTILRPGGFLNSNNTAAITLCLMFGLGIIVNKELQYLNILGVIIGVAIIILTQSRAALIFAGLYFLNFLYILLKERKYVMLSFITLIITSLIVINFTEEFYEITQNILERFNGDDSSSIRENIALIAFNAFLNSPIFGNGDLYLIKNYGLSSHNQILEILVSYGLFGILIFAFVFIQFYVPCTSSFLIYCIVPFLLFSHNFFDTFPYQVVLGLCLALDRNNFNKI